jgi:Glyoxalase/Bleomycin resistance protein/Dioxygenase superfamily
MRGHARFNKVAPQLIVRDVTATAEYYRDMLGFKILGYLSDPVSGMVERDSVEIHFWKADNAEISPNRLARKDGYCVYIWTSDIDLLLQEFKSVQVHIVEGPVTSQNGSREIIIEDINGFKIAFGD